MGVYEEGVEDAVPDYQAEKKKKEAEQVAADESRKRILAGGYDLDADMLKNLSAMNLGKEMGKKEFSNDAEWQRLKALREDMAKGFEGSELGAMRENARSEIAGSRAQALQNLRSNLARGGVGGARAAMLKGAQDMQAQKQNQEFENKLLLDQANMKRQGVGDLQDFIMRQKMGEAGYTFGAAGLQSASEAAKAAAKANSSSGKK